MTKPVLSDPIALRVPVDLLQEIEAIAASSERTRSWVMVRAMRLYVKGEGQETLALAKAKQDIRDGKFQDMDEFLDRLDADEQDDAA